MLRRNTDIWHFFQKSYPEIHNTTKLYNEIWNLEILTEQDERFAMMQQNIDLSKRCMFIDLGQPDISIPLSWQVQLSTNLTDKSVKINKVKYLSQYMYTTIKYWLNRISTSWCWLSYHLLFGADMNFLMLFLDIWLYF